MLEVGGEGVAYGSLQPGGRSGRGSPRGGTRPSYGWGLRADQSEMIADLRTRVQWLVTS